MTYNRRKNIENGTITESMKLSLETYLRICCIFHQVKVKREYLCKILLYPNNMDLSEIDWKDDDIVRLIKFISHLRICALFR